MRKTLCLLGVLLITLIVMGLYYFEIIPRKIYDADDFNIKIVYSSVDFNDNGIDDYSDFLSGAKIDAENHPKYDSRYWSDGFPPDNIGVCTDVIWRAFKEAGYNLREMVDKDISNNIELYPRVNGKKDKNIDFRRVPNLLVFFKKYAINLTKDITKIDQFQPGDIIIYGTKHVAIVSDKRNKKGRPYIIHNAGQIKREEDRLNYGKISGHFRFDASLVPNDMLIKFVEE